MSEKAKFVIPLLLLDIVGYNPKRNNWMSRFLSIFTFVLTSTCCIFILLELTSNAGLGTFARSSEMLFPEYQMFWKMITMVMFKEELCQLLKDSKQFWHLDEFGKEQGREFAKLQKYLKLFYLIYSTTALFAVIVYYVQTLLTKLETPMIITYGEKTGFASHHRVSLYVFHVFYLFFTSTLVVGFDGLLCYLIGHLISELKMVKFAFSRNGIKTEWDDAEQYKHATVHHIHVLKFATDLNKIYQLLFLNQYMSSLFGICFGIFLLTREGMHADTTYLIRYVSYVNFLVFQIFTFCFAGNLVYESSMDISSSIFYNHFSSERYDINPGGKMLSIMRAQRPTILSLGGFGYLNLMTFSSVIRSAFSFLALMNAIEEDA